MVTKDQEQHLQMLTKEQLAEYWCRLNVFDWPPNLPKDYWSVMCWISSRIGIKECLREWNKDNMDNKQFDDFWSHQNG